MHFSGIVSDSRQISSCSKKFGEIPTKFHQHLASELVVQTRKIHLKSREKSKQMNIHLSFSKNFGEIPTKFHQNLPSKWQNSIKKCRILNNSLFIFEKS